MRGSGDPASGDAAVDEAADGIDGALRLFAEVFDRSSYDGAGAAVSVTVHYGRDYDNAFWDGTQLVFGDGDGEIFDRFTKPVDVLGHELSHAVTEHSAGLRYQDQSGALNESVSDVFGSCLKQWLLGQTVDQADWLVGAGLFLPGVNARGLRDMANPGTAYDDPQLGKDPQGASMDDYIDTTDDNGGVHLNSGIPNRAFHLAATAIGGRSWEGAGAIWYAALTGGQVGPDTDFAGFAAATVAAAGDRQDWADAVRQAWETVGVTPVDGSTTAPTTVEPATDETLVVVRRTGGFAGRTTEGSVDLASHDARVPEVRTLVDRIDLTHVPRRQPAPRHVRLRLQPLRPLCPGARAAPDPRPLPPRRHRPRGRQPDPLNTDSSEIASLGRPARTADESVSGQRAVEGSVDVQGGAGDDGQLDVGLRDEQLDLGAAEQDRAGARRPRAPRSGRRRRRRVASTTRPWTSSS